MGNKMELMRYLFIVFLQPKVVRDLARENEIFDVSAMHSTFDFNSISTQKKSVRELLIEMNSRINPITFINLC